MHSLSLTWRSALVAGLALLTPAWGYAQPTTDRLPRAGRTWVAQLAAGIEWGPDANVTRGRAALVSVDWVLGDAAGLRAMGWWIQGSRSSNRFVAVAVAADLRAALVPGRVTLASSLGLGIAPLGDGMSTYVGMVGLSLRIRHFVIEQSLVVLLSSQDLYFPLMVGVRY